MGRQSGGAISAGAGSTTLPLMSIYALAANRPAIREIGISNVSAVAVAVKVVRLTTTGTQGGALVEDRHDPDGAAVNAALFDTHTVAPALGNDMGYRCQLGAAIGSGWVWTFGAEGLLIPVGVANGIGVIIENGTGQILQIYFAWD